MHSMDVSPMPELALLSRGTQARLIGPGTVLREEGDEEGDAPEAAAGLVVGRP